MVVSLLARLQERCAACLFARASAPPLLRVYLSVRLLCGITPVTPRIHRYMPTLGPSVRGVESCHCQRFQRGPTLLLKGMTT